MRDHHVTFVVESNVGPALYVFGGTNAWQTQYDDIQRAKISPDGTILAFEPIGTLPEARAGHCGVLVGKTAIFVGGVLGNGHPGIGGSTVRVPINDDGTIGTASKGPDLPDAVMHATCDVHGGYLYVVGGRGTRGGSIAQVVRARVHDAGTLDAFESLTPLSPDRSHHASFVRGEYLYVLGGLTGNPAGTNSDHSDVIRAKFEADGTLGAWQPAGNFDTPLSVSAAQLFADRVYVFGGYPGGSAYTDVVRRGTIGEDGSMVFEKLDAKLSLARAHVHQTPVWKTFIYSVGGHNDVDESIGTVDIGSFQ